ncbi:MAG: VWA domain-containing protein [Deltaproteobacteria bacterium]|nr:MAG: VWA domain-containing protein [Deltaproteobacteria bacterium]
MFLDFLTTLREEGVPVGMGEWLAFLRGLKLGLATDLEGLYGYGRAVLCRTEADYDPFDLAFRKTFEGLVLPDDLREQLTVWLDEALGGAPGALPPKDYDSFEELWRDFLERLATQRERHDRGNTWIGTRGTSAFGHSGQAPQGVRVGGSGGGRSAVRVAGERRWANYRADRTLDVREIKVALRALRSLARDGPQELDLDETIRETAQNAGDIQFVERPERRNRLRVVLLMDAGGSMAPHAERVEQLFSALKQLRTFKSLDVYFFHNCVYGWLYRDMQELDRVPTEQVLAELSPKHRLLFVGDASMSPYELHAAWGWSGSEQPSGLQWLQRIKARCPASVWLNPDPPRWWNHPTVSAIAGVFPMFELTVEGLHDAVRTLRAPH